MSEFVRQRLRDAAVACLDVEKIVGDNSIREVRSARDFLTQCFDGWGLHSTDLIRGRLTMAKIMIDRVLKKMTQADSPTADVPLTIGHCAGEDGRHGEASVQRP